MSLVEKLTFEDWKEKVIDSEIPVLVDYFSAWCRCELCNKQRQETERLAERLAGKMKTYQLDWDTGKRRKKHEDEGNEIPKGLAGDVRVFDVEVGVGPRKHGKSVSVNMPDIPSMDCLPGMQCLILFKSGQIVRQMLGYHSETEIEEFITDVI